MDSCLHHHLLIMAPVVLVELLSDPLLPPEHRRNLLAIPVMDATPGFWERAGGTRAGLLQRRLKPKLADTLIAQICIDHGVPLLTRDADFRPFAQHAGLHLVL